MKNLILSSLFLVLMSFTIGSVEADNKQALIESSVIEVIDHNHTDDECVLYLCVNDDGEVISAACDEPQPNPEPGEDPLECEGCTDPCPDIDLMIN